MGVDVDGVVELSAEIWWVLSDNFNVSLWTRRQGHLLRVRGQQTASEVWSDKEFWNGCREGRQRGLRYQGKDAGPHWGCSICGWWPTNIPWHSQFWCTRADNFLPQTPTTLPEGVLWLGACVTCSWGRLEWEALHAPESSPQPKAERKEWLYTVSWSSRWNWASVAHGGNLLINMPVLGPLPQPHFSLSLYFYPSLPLSLLFLLPTSFLYLGLSPNKPFASKSLIQALPLWELNSWQGPSWY